MRDLVIRLRKAFEPRVEQDAASRASPTGSQPFVLWRNRQLAAQRMRYPGDKRRRARPRASSAGSSPTRSSCPIAPPTSTPKAAGKGRLLTAGFHLMQGYFRDDAPLCELVLDEAGRRELDALWQELDFVTLVPMRQYKDFIFFERAEPPRFMREAEFDFARSEDKDATSEAKIEQLRDGLPGQGAQDRGERPRPSRRSRPISPTMSAAIRQVEQARQAAEPSHLEALATFAERAYRRPLSPAEQRRPARLLPRARASRTGWATRTRSATRSPASCCRPTSAYRVDPAAAGRGGRSRCRTTPWPAG